MVMGSAYAGDGISVIETGKADEQFRCLFYKDKGIPSEARYTSYDIFRENQWSEFIHSWGPNGTLLPHTINSYNYKSLIDEEGIGIICAYDEIWMSKYWYARSTGSDFAQFWCEFFFRPREINKSDLLMLLIKANCCRPCQAENVDELPCQTACEPLCGLPDTETVTDDQMITLPDGSEVTGKVYKSKLEDRDPDYKGCLEVCVVNTPLPVTNTTPPPVSCAGITMKCLKADLNQLLNVYYDNLKQDHEALKSKPDIRETWFTFQMNNLKGHLDDILNMVNAHPDAETLENFISLIGKFKSQWGSKIIQDSTFTGDPTHPGQITPKSMFLPREREPERPAILLAHGLYIYAANLMLGSLEINLIGRWRTLEAVYNGEEPNYEWFKSSLELLKTSSTPFGDNESSQFIAYVWSLYLNLNTKFQFLQKTQAEAESEKENDDKSGNTPEPQRSQETSENMELNP